MRTTFPPSSAAVKGGELSHPVAPPREGNSPSRGNSAAAGWIVARKSWFAFLIKAFHSFVSWAIGLSFLDVSAMGRLLSGSYALFCLHGHELIGSCFFWVRPPVGGRTVEFFRGAPFAAAMLTSRCCAAT